MTKPTLLVALVLAFAARLTPAQAHQPATSAKPNILIVLADDSGYSDLSCQGGEVATPNLDALATSGMRLTHFYNSARCCPTRASLLTGVNPHQADFPDMSGTLPDTVVTIPEVLRSAGYSTFMVGKWHLGREKKPTDRGFDEFFGMIGGFNSYWRQNPFYTRWPEGHPKRQYAPGQFYSTNAFGDYALDFIDQGRAAKKPWFMYLAFNAVHFPLHAPESEIERFEKLYSEGWDVMREKRLARMKELGLIPPDTALTPRLVVPPNRANLKNGTNDREIPAWDSLPEDRRKDLARRMAVYAAALSIMDENVGRVVKHLKETGQFDNTLIFYLSDNGACGEWDPFGFDTRSGPNNILHTGDDLKTVGGPESYASYGSGWANACVTPFRFYKQYTHEGGIITPLIVSWPNGLKTKPGTMDPSPGYITDLMATCADVAGAPYPTTRNGKSILPKEGASLKPLMEASQRPTQTICVEHEGSRMIREGDWKLVAERGPSGPHPWELYNLATDPTEIHDLAKSQPDKVTDLERKYLAWAQRVGARQNLPPRDETP